MLVYVNPDISGNVYIREGPSTASPSIKIPAYNFDKYGIMYDVDEVRDNSGTVWYHLRGLGWSMAKYFKEYGKGPEDPLKTWLIGLTREEIETAIAYLQQTIMDGDD